MLSNDGRTELGRISYPGQGQLPPLPFRPRKRRAATPLIATVIGLLSIAAAVAFVPALGGPQPDVVSQFNASIPPVAPASQCEGTALTGTVSWRIPTAESTDGIVTIRNESKRECALSQFPEIVFSDEEARIIPVDFSRRLDDPMPWAIKAGQEAFLTVEWRNYCGSAGRTSMLLRLTAAEVVTTQSKSGATPRCIDPEVESGVSASAWRGEAGS
jgi:hypothetical protein